MADSPEHEVGEASAVAAMFSESVLAANSRQVLNRITTVPAGERFEVLKDWVLPSATRPSFRLGGWFGETEETLQNSTATRRTVEPQPAAVAMIQLAKQLNRLDELHTQIAEAVATTNVDQQRQAALLALVAWERNQSQSMAEQLEKLLTLTEANENLQLEDYWPVLIVANALKQLPETQQTIRALLELLEPACRINNMSIESVHTLRLLGQIRANHFDSQQALSQPLKHWRAVERTNVISEGTGRPNSSWFVQDHEVRCIGSHDCEFLYYSIPLRGNFVIEADVSSDHYLRGHLALGGAWLSVQAADNLQTGLFRPEFEDHLIDPPLTKIDQWSRLRLQVQDNVVTTWFNGRYLHRRIVTDQSDPWLAIRNMRSHQSGVRNLRIVGDVEVPESIPLLTTDDLPGWNNYFDHTAWHQTEDGPSAELTVNRAEHFGENQFAENLLSYHRPMLEDGTIRYEFFYQPSEFIVHPAIGKTAFCFTPNGVRLHHLTNNDRAPDIMTSAAHQLNKQLPLRLGEWNAVEVSLTDDVITLRLNDTDIYRHRLTEDNRRTFGLFHYADQSAVRVRNIVWTGDWPKQLPSLEQQELAEPEHPCFAGLDELQEVMTHDFATQGTSNARFRLEGKTTSTFLHQRTNGVYVAPIVDGSWRGITVALKEPVFGDFDAILTFDDLDMKSVADSELYMELRGLDAAGPTVMPLAT